MIELRYEISRQVDLALQLEKMHEEALEFLSEGDYESYKTKMHYINELGNMLP